MAEKTDSPPDPNTDSPQDLSDGSGTTLEVNEKRLLRKLDAKLLPAVGVLYLLSFLDRSNGKPPARRAECMANVGL